VTCGDRDRNACIILITCLSSIQVPRSTTACGMGDDWVLLTSGFHMFDCIWTYYYLLSTIYFLCTHVHFVQFISCRLICNIVDGETIYMCVCVCVCVCVHVCVCVLQGQGLATLTWKYWRSILYQWPHNYIIRLTTQTALNIMLLVCDRNIKHFAINTGIAVT